MYSMVLSPASSAFQCLTWPNSVRGCPVAVAALLYPGVRRHALHAMPCKSRHGIPCPTQQHVLAMGLYCDKNRLKSALYACLATCWLWHPATSCAGLVAMDMSMAHVLTLSMSLGLAPERWSTIAKAMTFAPSCSPGISPELTWLSKVRSMLFMPCNEGLRCHGRLVLHVETCTAWGGLSCSTGCADA